MKENTENENDESQKRSRECKREERNAGIVGAIMAFVLAGALGTCIATSKRPHFEYSSITTTSVDQVFRDHDGYRIYYESDDHSVVELECRGNIMYAHSNVENIPQNLEGKFSHINSQNIRNGGIVIKDLEPGERGYANILTYKNVQRFGSDFDSTYVEIHLPKDGKISAGNETWGGKHKIHSSMEEIK